MNVFETETMAELCVRQGLLTEGIDIYRRLLRTAPDEMTRARRRRRLAELERHVVGHGPPIASGAVPENDEPALTARREAEGLVLEWTLPAALRAPALQILLVTRTKAGIATEARTLRLEGARGRTTLAAPALHSFRAAAGHLDGERFIPLIRLGAVI